MVCGGLRWFGVVCGGLRYFDGAKSVISLKSKRRTNMQIYKYANI